MYNPEKRIGEDEKPGLMVAVKMGKPGKFDPSRRIGESEPDETEEPQGADPGQLKDEAAGGICRALNVSTSAAPRLRQYLEAFVRACGTEAPRAESEPESPMIEDSKE